MPYTKTIVCLANSYKRPNGRCIAGREVLANGYGGWIRPVSDRQTEELIFLRIPVCEQSDSTAFGHRGDAAAEGATRAPSDGKSCHREWLLDKESSGSLEYAGSDTGRPRSLWINSDHSSAGVYDRISQAEAATLDNSLLLVRPEEFRVEVGRNGWNDQKSFRGIFSYNGTKHNLSVTDPIARDVLDKRGRLLPFERCLSLHQSNGALRA